MLDEKLPNRPFKIRKRQCEIMMKECLIGKGYSSSKSGTELRKAISIGDVHEW